MAASKTITVIGSLNIDLVTTTPRIPAGGETLHATTFSTGLGGKGANQAIACARLTRKKPMEASKSTGSKFPTTSDITVKMIGTVGDDSFGTDMTTGLRASSIDTSSISIAKNASTGVAVILVEEDSGENRILLTAGANHHLRPEDFLEISSLGYPSPNLIVLQLEIRIETVLQILRIAKMAKIPVLLNPAPAVWLPDEVFQGLDHLIVNEGEAEVMSGVKPQHDLSTHEEVWSCVVAAFAEKGVRHLIITLGANGACYWSSVTQKTGWVPAAKVGKVVDTTAAGDTFCGMYAVEVVRRNGAERLEMEDCVKKACIAAARTVERSGAQDSIPWADEVNWT